MSKQPEALRLAELFIDEEQGYWLDGFRHETYLLAAAELRRQHALIAELLEALRSAVGPLALYAAYGWSDRENVRGKVFTAINKALGAE